MAKRSNPVMSYIPGKSVIHALTGTTKLVFFLLFTFSSMLTYDTRVLLGLMVISFSCFAVSHIKFKDVSFVFWFMVVFLALNNFFIFLFSPDQGTELYGTRVVLCHLFGPYDLTREQLFYHFNISLKYFVALPIALLFITATNPSEFASSLNAVGVSYRIGYSVALALRYIPDIQRDYRNISTAQQARSPISYSAMHSVVGKSRCMLPTMRLLPSVSRCSCTKAFRSVSSVSCRECCHSFPSAGVFGRRRQAAAQRFTLCVATREAAYAPV